MTLRVARKRRITDRPYTDRRPAAVILGCRKPHNLGQRLNTVTAPRSECPVCHHRGGVLEVFEAAVRWPCGHTRDLPPLNPTGKATRP